VLAGAVTVGVGTIDDAEMAVGADVAAAAPFLFVAVTTKRRVRPASADVATYVALVCPAAEAHAPPAESQRSHWNV
jgi:hypothetical protein